MLSENCRDFHRYGLDGLLDAITVGPRLSEVHKRFTFLRGARLENRFAYHCS